jgi:hypothetical protein
LVGISVSNTFQLHYSFQARFIKRLASAKSQIIGIACRPKVFLMLLGNYPSMQAVEPYLQPIHRKPQIHPHRLGIGAGAGAAFAQGTLVRIEACGEGIRLDALYGLAHQVGEGGKGNELAGGE